MITCWVITEEGLTGTENQCLGVTDALGLTPDIKRIHLRQPWKSLSPWLGLEQSFTFRGTPLTPPWPDLVIAAGRKAVAAARYIKKRSGGRSYIVFLQNPQIPPSHFDLVAAPAHDGLKGKNVITTRATPNRVNAKSLTLAKAKFSFLLEPIPAPRVAVLIGGNSKSYRLTPARMTDFTQQLKNLSQQGYGLMVTASRRTGAENRAILDQAQTGAYIWDGTGDNPYHGFLAWADYIIVTADSASMISEAATSGKPVYIVPLEGGSRRFDKLHQSLISEGIIRIFDGTLDAYDYQALNDAALVADEIRHRTGHLNWV